MRKKKKKAIDPGILRTLVIPRRDTLFRQPRKTRHRFGRKRGKRNRYSVGIDDERSKPAVHLKRFLNTEYRNILDLDGDDTLLKNKNSIQRSAKDIYKSTLSRSEKRLLNVAKTGNEKKEIGDPNSDPNTDQKGSGSGKKRKKVYLLKEERFERYKVKDFTIEEADEGGVDTTRLCRHQHRRNEIVRQNQNKLFNDKFREIKIRKQKLKVQMRKRYPNGSLNVENRLDDDSKVFRTKKFRRQRKNIKRMKNLGQRRREFLAKKTVSSIFKDNNQEVKDLVGRDVQSKKKGQYFSKMTSGINLHSLIFGEGRRGRKRRELKTALPPVKRDFNILAPSVAVEI